MNCLWIRYATLSARQPASLVNRPACVRACLCHCYHIFIYLLRSFSGKFFSRFSVFFFFFSFLSVFPQHSIVARHTHTHFHSNVSRIYSILWASHKILMARRWPMDVIIYYIVLSLHFAAARNFHLTACVHAIVENLEVEEWTATNTHRRWNGVKLLHRDGNISSSIPYSLSQITYYTLTFALACFLPSSPYMLAACLRVLCTSSWHSAPAALRFLLSAAEKYSIVCDASRQISIVRRSRIDMWHAVTDEPIYRSFRSFPADALAGKIQRKAEKVGYVAKTIRRCRTMPLRWKVEWCKLTSLNICPLFGMYPETFFGVVAVEGIC